MSRNKIIAQLKRYTFYLSTDVGGQHCPCLVFERIFRNILSGVCLTEFFLSRFYPLSGFCPDFRKKSVRCLSVRPDKDKTELSGLSLSLSADVCSRSTVLHESMNF